MLKKNSKIYIAGHNGLVGRSVHKLLIKKGFRNILYKKKKDLDLTDEKKVNTFFANN